jgi:hypothetical protein
MITNPHETRLLSLDVPETKLSPAGVRGQFGMLRRERAIRDVARTAALFACLELVAVISVRMHLPSAEFPVIWVPERSTLAPM